MAVQMKQNQRGRKDHEQCRGHSHDQYTGPQSSSGRFLACSCILKGDITGGPPAASRCSLAGVLLSCRADVRLSVAKVAITATTVAAMIVILFISEISASVSQECRRHGVAQGLIARSLLAGRDQLDDSSGSLDPCRTCVLDGCAHRTMRIAHTIRNVPTR